MRGTPPRLHVLFPAAEEREACSRGRPLEDKACLPVVRGQNCVLSDSETSESAMSHTKVWGGVSLVLEENHQGPGVELAQAGQHFCSSAGPSGREVHLPPPQPPVLVWGGPHQKRFLLRGWSLVPMSWPSSSSTCFSLWYIFCHSASVPCVKPSR